MGRWNKVICSPSVMTSFLAKRLYARKLRSPGGPLRILLRIDADDDCYPCRASCHRRGPLAAPRFDLHAEGKGFAESGNRHASA